MVVSFLGELTADTRTVMTKKDRHFLGSATLPPLLKGTTFFLNRALLRVNPALRARQVRAAAVRGWAGRDEPGRKKVRHVLYKPLFDTKR